MGDIFGERNLLQRQSSRSAGMSLSKGLEPPHLMRSLRPHLLSPYSSKTRNEEGDPEAPFDGRHGFSFQLACSMDKPPSF
jgi:hypothetical protein